MLLGIDATNWIHRLWHAQDGRDVLGTVFRWMDALAARVQPDAIVACFDRRSFRHEIFPAYKSKRPPRALGLDDVLDGAPAALAEMVLVARHDGFEADDCLATLARIGRERGEKVVLATGDKDLRQCLADGLVTQIRGFATEHGRTTAEEWYTAGTLRATMGIEPAQYIEFQVLCGDSGDGVPGCPGWGEKTSLAAIQRFGSVAGVYDNLLGLKVSARQRNALMSFRPQVELMRRLVTLSTDIPSVKDLVAPLLTNPYALPLSP
jgi:DNA polymerase-1